MPQRNKGLSKARSAALTKIVVCWLIDEPETNTQSPKKKRTLRKKGQDKKPAPVSDHHSSVQSDDSDIKDVDNWQGEVETSTPV